MGATEGLAFVAAPSLHGRMETNENTEGPWEGPAARETIIDVLSIAVMSILLEERSAEMAARDGLVVPARPVAHSRRRHHHKRTDQGPTEDANG